ncbi:hypothetical protein EV368DRAFT_89807 [Lentinula lateritia]|nr:hypothetical protein EV368DRAFT_89807 [Lentinula lateritia]
MKGSKYILIRYISARSAASLASEYQNSVADNTSDAKIQQARENGLLKREQMDSLRLAPHSAQNHHIAIANNTPEYSLETPGGAAFAYPRGTPDNPTVSCPVGSKPILPNGLKFGTLAYYYQPSHVAMISSGQTEEDDLVPVKR